MSNPKPHEFARAQAAVLAERLSEPRRHIQVVAGPRQVGKTTLVLQALRTWGERARYASADEPSLRDHGWLAAQWEAARAVAGRAGRAGAVLALDEIQKIPGWSETVKRHWDEDTRQRSPETRSAGRATSETR
jgi:predicted AAA+ superfamily ATPase